MPLYTTLKKARSAMLPGTTMKLFSGRLSEKIEENEPLSYATLAEGIGIDDALWCLRAEPRYYQEYRQMTVKMAGRLENAMVDPASLAALNLARRLCAGEGYWEISAAYSSAQTAYEKLMWQHASSSRDPNIFHVQETRQVEAAALACLALQDRTWEGLFRAFRVVHRYLEPQGFEQRAREDFLELVG